MMNDLGHPGRREAVVALAVACVLVLVSWLVSRGSGSADEHKGGEPASLASQDNDSVVDIDLSPDVTTAELDACLTNTFGKDAAGVSVLYAEVQKTESGQASVLVLRNKAGELRLCDSFGADSPAVLPVKYADAGHAVRLLTNGRQAWECDGTRLAGFTVSDWLSVGTVVDTVAVRFLVNGASSPWYTTKAQHGFVHVHGWLAGQNVGAKVTMQTRIDDKAGHAVHQDALPTHPTPITGCAGGGDIQIG
jgi:hypothetical protein